jgi:hypothetical protein
MEKIMSLEKEMVALGPRLTGNRAHNAFVDIIKRELQALDYKVYSDKMTMKKRWEPKEWKLSLDIGGERIDIPDVYYFPYSGCTPPEGVSGKLHNAGRNIGNFLGSNDKIAIISMLVFDAGVGLIFKKRASYPHGYMPPKKLASPVVSSFVFPPMLKRAKLMGAKAVICIMHGCSSGNAAWQYLPFITSYQDCPAVWVDDRWGNKILEACKKGGTATLTMTADLIEKSPTETVYAILKGKSDKETILINTHTDGTNAFEENGAIALLSLANHYKSLPIDKRERTLVFSFVTGHFQLPQFGSPLNQATNRFLKKHKELWSGRDGAAKAVAGVSIEHLGCSEWRDTPDHQDFVQVSDIDPELVFTANKKLSDIYIKALEGRTKVKTLTLKPKNFVYFGEGQPMYMAGIPTISLVSGPDYLCTNAPDGYIDKINFPLMEEQIITFQKVIDILDKASRTEIGKCELFDIGFTF